MLETPQQHRGMRRTSGAEMRSVFATTVTLLHNDAATCDLPLADWSPPNSCSNSLEAELLMRLQCALCARVCAHAAQPASTARRPLNLEHKAKFLLFRVLWRHMFFGRFLRNSASPALRESLHSSWRRPLYVKLDFHIIKNKNSVCWSADSVCVGGGCFYQSKLQARKYLNQTCAAASESSRGPSRSAHVTVL